MKTLLLEYLDNCIALVIVVLILVGLLGFVWIVSHYVIKYW